MTKSTSKTKGKNSENKIPALQESIISRVNADKTVSIVNLDLDNVCYSLDGLAAEIWLLIDGTNDLKEIKAKVVEQHQPPKDLFEKDFDQLFGKLEKENLISLSE